MSGVAWAVEALIASALLIALVLLIRVPVRRSFGPQVAYALWALPVLRLALPPLPASWRESVAAPIVPLSQVGEQVTVFIAPATGVATGGSPAVSGVAIAGLWAAGAAGFLLWHMARYWRFKSRLLAQAIETDRVGGVTIVESRAAAGPLAFGIARRFVAFPRDFAARYDAKERDLALAHELGHHARGDLIANWVALAVLALHWFNPLAWVAFRAFRADQEMANDARVLAGRGAAERHAYACAIVKAAHGGVISAACHLHTVDDLKGRLKMLSSTTARGRILAGSAATLMLTVTALGITASGTAAAAQMRAKVEQATGVDVAAITPTALFQAPPAPPAPPAPVAGEGDRHRIVVTNDGRTTVYDGADADAYAVAHPAPLPPVPPVPPMPATPPAPPAPAMEGFAAAMADRAAANADHAQAMAERALREAPQVTSANCGRQHGVGDQVVLNTNEGGRNKIVICNDRIATLAEWSQKRALTAREQAAIHRQAVAGMRAGMAQARAAIAANREISAEDRREALRDIDDSAADAEHDLNQELGHNDG